MILLNAVRVILGLVAYLIFNALCIAYGPNEVTQVVIAALVAFVALCTADISTGALIEFFNPEDKKP